MTSLLDSISSSNRRLRQTISNTNRDGTFGCVPALLIEAVIMLIAMIASSRWVIRYLNVPQTLGSTTPIGLVAIAILIPAEIAGALGVRGLSLNEYLASFVTAPGVISPVIFLLFAAMPTLVMLLARGRGGAIPWASWSTPKATGAASQPWTEIREANRGQTLLQ